MLGVSKATMSPYPYADQNPIRFIDPSGLCPQGDIQCLLAMNAAGLPQFNDQPYPPVTTPLTRAETVYLLNQLSMESGFISGMTLESYPPAAITFGAISACATAGSAMLRPNLAQTGIDSAIDGLTAIPPPSPATAVIDAAGKAIVDPFLEPSHP